MQLVIPANLEKHKVWVLSYIHIIVHLPLKNFVRQLLYDRCLDHSRMRLHWLIRFWLRPDQVY
jgi:hypothetical protein